MGKSNIEYCDKVWNPVSGCTPISTGCDNCWAQAHLKRFKQPSGVTLHPNRLDEPLRWRKPQMVFVCSQGDLFHDDVVPEFIYGVFKRMTLAPQHTFLILTKRPSRMATLLPHIRSALPDRLEHVWLGVSVEDQGTADERIPILLSIPAAKRWVSIEPMLGPVDLEPYLPGDYSCIACGYVGNDFGKEYCQECGEEFPPPGPKGETVPCSCGCSCYEFSCPKCGEIESFGVFNEEWPCNAMPRLDWVALGCESGKDRRPFEEDWARKVWDDCQIAGIPFMYKQGRDENGKLVKLPLLDGRLHDDRPGKI